MPYNYLLKNIDLILLGDVDSDSNLKFYMRL